MPPFFACRIAVLLMGGLLAAAGLPVTVSAEQLASLPPRDAAPELPSPALAPNLPVHVEREIHIAGVDQFHKWTDMLKRWTGEVTAVNACAAASNTAVDCLPEEWTSLTTRLAGLDRHVMLDEINRAINAHPYIASLDNWGTADHWETPFEFMQRNGQCQDYAIAKFMLLRAMGFASDQLRILVVRDVERQVDHAVLVAYLDNQAWLLDSLDDHVVPLASASAYRAYYAINESGWWLYLPNPIGFSISPAAPIAAR